MNREFSRSTRWSAGAVAACLALALAAPPSARADTPRPAAPAATSLRAATSARLATLDTSRAVRLTQAGTPAASSEGGRSFIHSPKGIAAVLLLAGGFTWAIVSRSKDAVHSPARK